MCLQEILDLQFDDKWNTGYVQTVRSWLKNLLVKVVIEEDNFSASHPWGNSDYQAPLIIGLIKHGVLTGSISEDDNGYIDLHSYDFEEYQNLIKELIWAM